MNGGVYGSSGMFGDSQPIYSTFKPPPETANAATATDDDEGEDSTRLFLVLLQTINAVLQCTAEMQAPSYTLYSLILQFSCLFHPIVSTEPRLRRPK